MTPSDDDALAAARRRVQDEPLSEEAARALMTRLAEAGDYAGALSEYVRIEGRLAAALSVAPSRVTRRLLEQIRRSAPPPLGTTGVQPP